MQWVIRNEKFQYIDKLKHDGNGALIPAFTENINDAWVLYNEGMATNLINAFTSVKDLKAVKAEIKEVEETT